MFCRDICKQLMLQSDVQRGVKRHGIFVHADARLIRERWTGFATVLSLQEQLRRYPADLSQTPATTDVT